MSAHFTLLISLELIKYVDYLNNNESFFKMTKEYSDEEACIFQLISNKKKQFLNFFTDFFINLPGFVTIYKDKFFSKIKDFIDDNNYIFSLKDEYLKKYPENNKNQNNDITEGKNGFLGLKRKRYKENKTAYDQELKLLENDYPQIIENDEEQIIYNKIQIKKEKISDEDLIDMDQSNENITDASIAPPAYLINEKKSKTSGIKERKKNFELSINEALINKNKRSEKKNLGSRDRRHSNNVSTSQKASKLRKRKAKNSTIKKCDYVKIYSPLKTYHYNNIVNNVIDNSGCRKEYIIKSIGNPNTVNMLYGINSRLDKMPKINIYKKKGYQINRSAGKLLENIKEKLINIGKKSKNSKRGKCLSDDRLKLDEMQNFKKFVNDNFYGGEKLKSPKFTVNDYKDDKKENFINMNNRNSKDVNNVNNVNNINTTKKKKKLIKMKDINKSPLKNNYNSHVNISYKIILNYKKRGREKLVTKSEFIPEAIIIDKSILIMNEIKSLFNSLFKKKNVIAKSVIKEKAKSKTEIVKKKETKPRKKRSRQRTTSISDRILRDSTTKQHISHINYKTKKPKNKNRNNRRKRKIFIRSMKKTEEKKVNYRNSEHKRFDSRESNVMNISQIRTNCDHNNKSDFEMKNEDDRVLVTKTCRMETISDDGKCLNKKASQMKVGSHDSDFNLEAIDALKGFNYLYQQK